jgi:hypothetical protein
MDNKQLTIALSQFEALRTHLPSLVKEANVTEFHAIVDAIGLAAGETNLDQFKIADNELKKRITSRRPAAYDGTRGHTMFSKERYCDPDRFQRQVQGLASYLERQGYRI